MSFSPTSHNKLAITYDDHGWVLLLLYNLIPLLFYLFSNYTKYYVLHYVGGFFKL